MVEMWWRLACVAELGSCLPWWPAGQFVPAFTDGNVSDAENDADSVDSTFSSPQPPDARVTV